VIVAFDHDRVVQVVSNLLGNAMKSLPQGATVVLSVERREREVEFVLIDDGPGIGAALLPHIFERFVQIDSSVRRRLGLGLYICDKIVTAHGGRTGLKASSARARPSGSPCRLISSVALLSIHEGWRSWRKARHRVDHHYVRDVGDTRAGGTRAHSPARRCTPSSDPPRAATNGLLWHRYGAFMKRTRRRSGTTPETAQRASGTSGVDGDRSRSASPPQRPANRSAVPPFLVAAVGASAGGLEAFTSLVRGIPGDANLALLLVQHLTGNEKSHLAELLGHNTAREFIEARDGIRIKPGCIYVIPPDTCMTVNDRSLAVLPRAAEPGTGQPVNEIFRSVADQYRERAIGVVLSGGAHDGALGLREIKAAGGITFVQSPEQATSDGMPRAAIATGAVDAVLPVEKIGDELVRLSTHCFFRGEGGATAAQQLDDVANLGRVFQLLRRASGVDFTQYKLSTISRRIQRRIALHGMGGVADYAALLQQTPKEVESLQEDLLIHVTSFFREPESFEVLKKMVLPRLLADHDGESAIRVWVPGCSTGEEAYSVAMILLEFLGDKRERVSLQVFGTDVSERTIDRARRGIYPEGISAEVAPDRLRRFFSRSDGGYRINNMVREGCVFARHDITRDPPFSKLDLVVCRNLFTYLGQHVHRKVIGIFHYALRPRGYLVLGRSESIGPHRDLFSAADKRFKIYARKRGATRPDVDFRWPRALATSAPVPAFPQPRSTASPGRDWDLRDEVTRLLIDRYPPPGVIVDGDLHVVRSLGQASRYLELPAGEATLDVLKMVQPGLSTGLRAALEEARTLRTAVRKEGLRLRSEGQSRSINLEVTPFGTLAGHHFLVAFEEDRSSAHDAGTRPAGKKAAGKAGKRKPSDGIVDRLDNELAATREHLQAIIHDLGAANEELQSANEEILSSNEELQSTNEELDTTKEELQSTNEDLSTLNAELEGRAEEMTVVNNDLLNLLTSVQIPMVIVTNDLKIRRLTPAAEKALNLIPSDVGRPIGHIKPNIICPDLENLTREVVETMTIRERDVEDNEGKVYALRIRPYRSVENTLDGAVLTLFDVSCSRDKDAELTVAQSTGEAIMSTVREPILLLDGDLKVRRANQAFLEKFQMVSPETEGKFIYDLGEREWDIPALRHLLEEILPDKKNFDGFVVERYFGRVGHKKMLVDGRRIEASLRANSVILLIIRDVTAGAA
jgi:two-component system CheB/CheR fusion protein